MIFSSSASPLSSLWSGFSNSPSQLCQLSMFKVLLGALSSLLSAGWWLIPVIQWTFHCSVCPPGRSFADKAGGKGDNSESLNIPTQQCGIIDQNALMISSVSKMYSMGVSCLIWVGDSFCGPHRFCLACHISKQCWTLAILSRFFSSASLCISNFCSVFDILNTRLSPANIPSLAGINQLTRVYSWRVSHVVFDFLQPFMYCATDKLASTPTQCGVVENVMHALLPRSGYFDYVTYCWHH